MHKRILVVGMILVMVSLTVGSPGLAAPQYQARSVISYPSDGMTVSGVVDVTGVATHPNLNSYQLRFAAGPQPSGDSQWIDFAIVEGTQVENGVLGTWDTTILPDGQYTLALAVWGANDAASPYVFFATSLTVNNSVPVAEPTEEPPTPEPLATAVIGPTATPVAVEQPPTPTVPASPTAEGETEVVEEVATPSAGDEEGFSLPIEFAELRGAFVAGGKIVLWLFSLWALYLFVKALVRWLLRQRARGPWK
ncbi:MAG: hypothetical protein GY832_18225 [Chloroflexi bacterium]|nr:hypothetical protein [Chloroflexota bacterium]